MSLFSDRRLFVLTGLAALVGSSIVFASCSTSQSTETQDQAPGMAIEKKGDTTLSGKLTKKEGKYYLERTGKAPQEVDSNKVDLTGYVDKTVSITGQYSGITLFAGKIDLQ